MCASFALLRAVRPEERRFSIGDFAPAQAPHVANELFLLEDHRPAEAVVQKADEAAELLLDDVLVELTPDSRVVRLFDAASMPTPAQLRDRIERHLGAARAPVASTDAPGPDASQALHDALAELRRSLR